MYSSYDQNASPPLRWTEGPAGTQSYAILAEDPDASITPLPVVHWVAWKTFLPRSRELRERDSRVWIGCKISMACGKARNQTSAGSNVGYKGPRPPEGDAPHHYHFEVFALDEMIDLRAGANREDLVQAMRGHVLAKGGEYGCRMVCSGGETVERTS